MYTSYCLLNRFPKRHPGYPISCLANICFSRLFSLPEDSYFLLSLRIVSEDFTEDLKDRSSSKFINLERNLTTEVRKVVNNFTPNVGLFFFQLPIFFNCFGDKPKDSSNRPSVSLQSKKTI